VKTMCRVLGVSESGYYVWCKRLPSRRQAANEQLVEHIRVAYEQGRHVYGSPCFV
jgi:putative transposase